jgi:hypothetical protein
LLFIFLIKCFFLSKRETKWEYCDKEYSLLIKKRIRILAKLISPKKRKRGKNTLGNSQPPLITRAFFCLQVELDVAAFFGFRRCQPCWHICGQSPRLSPAVLFTLLVGKSVGRPVSKLLKSSTNFRRFQESSRPTRNAAGKGGKGKNQTPESALA